MQLTLARSGQRQGISPFMVDSGHMMRRAVDRRGPKPIHRSGHPEFVELVAEDPLLRVVPGRHVEPDPVPNQNGKVLSKVGAR